MGNMLEAYDFCLYGLLAVVFAKLFFPANYNYALTFSFLLFTIAYISRPFGSLLWGSLADRYGRKPILMATLAVMGISAVGMAIVPKYSSIGITAAFIILFLRLLQGIAFGGEYPTTMVMLYETAPKHLKGCICSLTSSATCFGHVIGLLLIISALLLTGKEAFYDWSWRFLFGVSIVFLVLITYIRRNLKETLQIEKQETSPFKSTLKQWRTIIKIVLFVSPLKVLFFTYTYYIGVLLRYSQTSISEITVFAMQSLMMMFLICLIPVMAYVGDVTERVKQVKYSLLALIVGIIPIYKLLISQNLTYAIIAILCLGIFVAAMAGSSYVIMLQKIRKDSRVSMAGVSDSFAVMIFGSTAPMINEILVKTFNSNLAPAYYILVLSIISLFSLVSLNKQSDVL